MVRSAAEKPLKPLPPERAFVLQLEADIDLSAGEVGGRVEHVVSGQTARFQSLAQLLAFLRRVLGTTGHEEALKVHPSRPDPSEKAGKDRVR